MISSHLKSQWTLVARFLLLLLAFCPLALATNLTGTFKNPDGTPVNGKLIFLLSQPARLNDQSAQIVPMVKIFSVTNGLLEAGAFVYGNDVLVPTGTYYLVRLVDSNNNLLFEQKWAIIGVNLDLGTLTPTTTGVVLPDPLLKNVSVAQAVQGPISFSSPLTAFSLTLNGNLNPGSPNSYNLGSATAPWQELFASRWSSLFTVGNSNSTAQVPSAQPGYSVSLSGGSIADGTYYFQITYVNRNGETTGSPTRTVTVSGGGGNAKIYIGNADSMWASGCYGFRVYAATSSGGLFYLQTPNPVSSDFMVDSTTHYIGLGSFGARLTSLTFSGTQIPTTNTAAIDPLQVALNSTMRQSDYGLAGATLIVPAFTDGTAYTLTTPLIVNKQVHLIGSGGPNTTVNGQTRILTSFARDPKIAAVMMFGGDSTIEQVGIKSDGNALMILGGAGYQSAYATRLQDSYLWTTDTTHTYSALVLTGILYDLHFDNVNMRGDKAVVEYLNFSGGMHYFSNARWDAGGPSFIKTVPGWIDPDDGTSGGPSGFSLGASPVMLSNIRGEQGTGILWDCVGLNIVFDNVHTADSAIVAGTDSIAKFGTDATFGGSAGPVVLRDTSFGTSSNARVGTNWVGSQGTIRLYGTGNLGFGTSTGPQLTLDLNNIQGMQVWDFAGGAGSFDPNAATTTPHAINVHDNTLIYAVGNAGGGTNTIQWQEVNGRLVFSYKTGNNWGRGSNWSLVNDVAAGNNFQVRRGSDDAYILDIPQGNSPASFRHNLRIMATAGAPATLFVGTSSATATGGSIALVNQGSVQARNGAGTADVLALQVQSDNTVHVGTTNAAGVRIGSSSSAPIKQVISTTATLDFGAITAPGCASDLTVTATGAAIGDTVSLGAPNGSVAAGVLFFAWVSATDTVTVRSCAFTGAPDPASGSFRLTVVKF